MTIQDNYSKVTFGQNVFIGENVKIGNGTIIGHNVVLHNDTTIGSNVRIDDNTVIGKNLMKAPNSAMARDLELPGTIIGNDCLIGTLVVIYRGAKLAEKILVADQAAIQFKTEIGFKTIVGRGVLIESNVTVGEYVKLESGCYITAFSTIEDRCFIAPYVATSNDNFVGRTDERFDNFKGVTVKKGGRIGVNSTILPGKTIGEDALIAGGSVVTKDIPSKKIYAGVPAKEFGDVEDKQLLKNNI